MDKFYMPLTGVEGVAIATGIIDDAGQFSAGVPSALIPVQNVNWAGERSTKSLYAGNKRQKLFYGTTEEKITFEVPDLSAEEDAKFRGLYMSESSGRTYGTGKEKPPYVALGLLINKGDDDYVYVWFLKGTITGGEVSAESQTNDVNPSSRKYTFESIITDHLWNIDGKMRGLSWVKGDTTTDAFNPAGWFDQVQTPDTESAPPQLQLVSIVPNDGATDVAIDTALVLTFSNKIRSEHIRVIDSVDGSIFDMTKAWDEAGKVLTMTPKVNYDVSTQYVVPLIEVKDVYGQILTEESNTFVTAAS